MIEIQNRIDNGTGAAVGIADNIETVLVASSKKALTIGFMMGLSLAFHYTYVEIRMCFNPSRVVNLAVPVAGRC
jgi:hypothetical protein